MTDNGFPAPGLDEPTRQRVFAALRDELARAVEAATARGVTREAIDAYLDQRLTDMRYLAEEASTACVDATAAEDVQDDSDEAIQLRRIGG